MEDLPDGGLVDAQFFADVHRPYVVGVHLQDSPGQGFSCAGFAWDFDADIHTLAKYVKALHVEEKMRDKLEVLL